MAKTKQKETEGFLSVSSTVLGQRKEEMKRIKVRPFQTDTANVSVKMGATIPTGDYSSARIDVMISMPCYVEEIPAVYKQVRSTVEKLVDFEVKKIGESIG